MSSNRPVKPAPLPSPLSQVHEDQMQLCKEHATKLDALDKRFDTLNDMNLKLGRVEGRVEDVFRQAEKTNGRTTQNEASLSAMAAQMAAQQTMWIGAVQERQRLEARIDDLEKSMGNMKDWKAELKGGARGVMGLVQQAATIVALLMTGWMAWSGHVQAIATAARK